MIKVSSSSSSSLQALLTIGRRLSQSSACSGLRTQGGSSARSKCDSSPLSSLILNADGLDLHLCLTRTTLKKGGGLSPAVGEGLTFWRNLDDFFPLITGMIMSVCGLLHAFIF